MKLIIILDCLSWQDRRSQGERLDSDGGRLLKFLLQRLEIPRESWVHTYCFLGERKELPNRKKERLETLEPYLAKVERLIDLHKSSTLVGLGRIACEFLTGTPQLISKAGTCWSTSRSKTKAWISYSPEACLFDPGLAVDMTGVLANAAARAGIKTGFNLRLPLFVWEPFLKVR
jgi:uracil-DNA glycosylase